MCTCPDSLKSKSESFNKRNQPIEASCKTCGGSSLVDGIRSISGNMLSTVNMEVAKSINPELSWWKAVKKGRRSRNTVARRLNEGMKVINRSPKRVGDFSGSDSDKVPCDFFVMVLLNTILSVLIVASIEIFSRLLKLAVGLLIKLNTF